MERHPRSEPEDTDVLVQLCRVRCPILLFFNTYFSIILRCILFCLTNVKTLNFDLRPDLGLSRDLC